MSGTKQPKPGEYWCHKNSTDIAYFIGFTFDNEMVWQCCRDSVEVGNIDWSGWYHEPLCTGFDWIEQTEPVSVTVTPGNCDPDTFRVDYVDPHVLPEEPAWLSRLANATGTHSMSDFSAHTIARYVRMLREAAWPIIRELESVGDDTNWVDGDETDRVYPWYEIEPLKHAVLSVDSPVPDAKPQQSTVTPGNCDPSTFKVDYSPIPPDPGEGYRLINPAVDVPQEGDEYYAVRLKTWRSPIGATIDFATGFHYRRRDEPQPYPKVIRLFVPLRAISEPESDWPVRCSLTGVKDVASWIEIGSFEVKETL